MLAGAIRLVVIALLTAGPTATAGAAGWRGGIGIVGDSYSDEYEFYSPYRSKARNWVEILATARKLDFGSFSDRSRGEPRNQGFAYNWARSSATTEDAVAAGQHTGLAAQVARHEVGLVAVFLGGNDFIEALKAPDPASAVKRVLPRAEANIRSIVETLLAADPHVKLVLATIPNVCDLPEFAEPIRTGEIPTGQAREVTAALRRFNATIRAMAIGNPRIAVADLDLHARVANLISRDFVPVGGRRIDRAHPGAGPAYAFLEDGRHASTVGQGLLARVFVQAVNAKFGAEIPPLSDREILAFAESQSAATVTAEVRAAEPSTDAARPPVGFPNP